MGRTAVGVRGSPGRSVAPRSCRTCYRTALEAKWIHITELRRLRRAHLAPAESQYNTRADSRRGLSLLLAANPGLRRGRDNGLEAAVALVGKRYPHARFVYTSSTAVYADRMQDSFPVAAFDECSKGYVEIPGADRRQL